MYSNRAHSTEADASQNVIECILDDCSVLTCSVLQDGTLSVSGCTHNGPIVTLPSSIDGRAITAIGYKAFAYDQGLKGVTLPEGLETIESFAFAASSIEAIGFPTTVKTIAPKAFFRCVDLSSIDLNEGLVSIGANAFTESSVSSVFIPSTVVELGHNAFSCSSLCFDEPLPSLVISDKNPHFTIDSQGSIYHRDDDGLVLLELCDPDRESLAVIPGTRAIGAYACAHHKKLQNVLLPDSIESIGEYAFFQCENMKAAPLPEGLAEIGKGAFKGTSLSSLNIPASLKFIGEEALVTTSSTLSVPPPTLKRCSVAPGNERFFMRDCVLYERISDRTCRAVISLDTCEEVRIEDDVVELCPYAFNCNATLRKLYIHDHLYRIGFLALAVHGPVTHFEMSLATPVDGHSLVVLDFSTDGRVQEDFMNLLRGADLDLEDLYSCYDHGIEIMRDGLASAKMSLDRLDDPIFLKKRHRDSIKFRIKRNFARVCLDFALSNHLKGFDQMLEHGFLAENTFPTALENAMRAENPEVTSHLLQIKRDNFGKQRESFDL